jgi:TonB family protein
MQILLAPRTLAVILFMGFTGILNEGQQPDESYRFDSVITNRQVMLFRDFEQAVQLAAARSGVPPKIAALILQEFAQTNKLRVTPYAELRGFLLEAFYRNNIPYPVAQEFLTSLSGNVRLPVDTGFLEVVHTVDLGNKSIYQLGKEPGLTPPRAIFQPLPPYTEAARVAHIEGVILLKCVVLEDGTVANCKVERTAGWGLDESALLTIQNRWKFEPARLNGKPIAVQANVEVSMRLY